VSGAKRAIEKIGPKAIPFLLNWIRGEQSSASVYVPDGSLQAFRILGSRARPAIPQLAAVATNGLADSSDCSGSAARAVYALAGIGPAAVPVLSDFLTNRDAVGVKCVAIDAIKKMETDCSAAVPALLSCLRERDEKVAARAVDALGALGGHQRLGAYRAPVFLALTNNLQTRFPLRREILLALYAFGDQAAPALINAFHDKESGVRFIALSTLIPAAPSALTNKDVLVILAENFYSRDPERKSWAASALRAAGQVAKAQKPDLAVPHGDYLAVEVEATNALQVLAPGLLRNP
jgi:HEAT repeat protein